MTVTFTTGKKNVLSAKGGIVLKNAPHNGGFFMDLKEYETVSAIRSTALQACLDIIIETLKAERGFISLHDPHEGKLRAFAVHNIDADNLFFNAEISQSVINLAY
jgi:hypothetical protein